MVAVVGGAVETWSATATDGTGGAPVLFLHEGLGSVRMWRDVPARVHADTHTSRAVAFSRHGYGASAPAQLPRTVGYMHHEADVVLPDLLAQLGIEWPVLVGHSDGASIALLFAGSGRAVSGLVLVAPHVFVEDVTIASIEAARSAYETTDLRDRLARHHTDADVTFRGWNDIWLDPAFRAWNIEERLSSIDCPVLVVQGDQDPYGTTAQLDAIESQVAGPTTRLLVPGAGHAPHLEAPEQCLATIIGFINDLGTR
ncbi:MAG: alpha/beta hydrolase [Acidimicrobiia bacterium]|nr:alpha/beta hydrolase [Acidimicrobiia bacterium]